jgi:hypothetical protein
MQGFFILAMGICSIYADKDTPQPFIFPDWNILYPIRRGQARVEAP